MKDKTYIGIIVYLDNELNILDANENFLQLMGYSQGEIVTHKITDLILPKDKSVFYDVMYNSLVTQDITIRMYHKTGAFRFFSLIIQSFDGGFLILGNPIKNDFMGYDYFTDKPQENLRLGISKEINDIKDLLKFQDDSLNFIMDVLPVDVWIKDKYGKYIYCNEEFTKHTGFKYEEVVGKNDHQIFEREIAIEFEQSDATAIKSGNVFKFVFESKSEQLLTWTEVTKIPLFNDNNEYVGIIGFSVDISSSKNLENKYFEESKRIEVILDNLNGVIFELSPHGKVLFASGRLKEKFEVNLDGETGALDFIKSKDDPHLFEQIRIALGGKEVKFDTYVGDVNVMFTLVPILNKYNTHNLIGYGRIIGDNDE
jgi:PAS domain S-box-containing protein